MKVNLARSGLCSFVASVDFGLYSSIVGTRCDCCVRAIRGHSSAEPAANMLTKTKSVRQNFIRQLPVSKSQTIASHEQDIRGYRKPIHNAGTSFRSQRKLARVVRGTKSGGASLVAHFRLSQLHRTNPALDAAWLVGFRLASLYP